MEQLNRPPPDLRDDNPKQFGIRAVMVWVTLASLMMGASAMLNIPELGVTLLLLCGTIAIAQRCLFKGRQPLLASMLAGAAFCGVWHACFGWINYGSPGREVPLFLRLIHKIVLLGIPGAITGVIVGLFVGSIVYAITLAFETKNEGAGEAVNSSQSGQKSTTVI